MLRKPAVAGRFYPGQARELTDTLRELIGTPVERRPVFGAVVPHAGYMYSGPVAGAVYSLLDIPQRVLVMCPNHTGRGVPLSIMSEGEWETPLGMMQVDTELCEALKGLDPDLEDDTAAHRFEHALEVQLPFIQYLAGSSVKLIPITIGIGDWDALDALGGAIAELLKTIDPNVLVLASSDMNHYESDSITRIKDHKAIDRILDVDARGLYEVVRREKISMCGYGPASSMLVAARHMGRSTAELIRYATSGDASGDYDRVVGYAGMVVA